MGWIVVSVVGVLLSVVGVLFVVAPGVRQFCWGAVCGLGVAGGLLSWWQLSTTLEPTRESHTGAPGKETAVSWVPRASRPGPPGVSTAPAPPEAVGTPAEAAQAVQRFRRPKTCSRHPRRRQPSLGRRPPFVPPQRRSWRRWPLPCPRLHDRQRWRLRTPTRSHGERCPHRSLPTPRRAP